MFLMLAIFGDGLVLGIHLYSTVCGCVYVCVISHAYAGFRVRMSFVFDICCHDVFVS